MNAADFIKGFVAHQFRDCAHGAAAAHSPDGNIFPSAAAELHDGSAAAMLIDPSYMETANAKENLVVVLRRFIREKRAVTFALMSPVWMVKTRVEGAGNLTDADAMSKARAIRKELPDYLGDAPDAQEYVVVWSVSRFTALTWFAPILRHENGPPTLGPWSEMKEGSVLENRFLDRLQQSIVAVS